MNRYGTFNESVVVASKYLRIKKNILKYKKYKQTNNCLFITYYSINLNSTKLITRPHPIPSKIPVFTEHNGEKYKIFTSRKYPNIDEKLACPHQMHRMDGL